MVDLYGLSVSHTNLVFNIILICAFILNLAFAFTIIFMERKSAGSIWAWLLVLVLFPIIGFILYLLFGRQIQNRDTFKVNEEDKIGLEDIVNEQLETLMNNAYTQREKHLVHYRDMIQMLLFNNSAFFTTSNEVQIFTNGNDKFEALLKDIKNAKTYIHIQYYIFRNDSLGNRIIEALTEKLEEGLEVKMLYDDMGSRVLTMRDFMKFKAKGGKVAAFFPSKLPLINLRMNNRNHRKIVTIDGEIGYVGGFNVGNEYLGLSKKFGNWRDTHLRIHGDAVNALELRFITDWNSQSSRDSINYDDKYFPDVDVHTTTGIQIASSGPDESWEQIKYGYMKMISMAKSSIYIQTPYFIPDQSFMDAIKIAALGGVDVKVMIPCKPDHPFVYWATYQNVADLLEAGVKVYTYEDGFLHSKVVLIDDEIASVGTANMDHRSFTLNFEVNAFLYSESITQQLREAFEKDLEVSKPLTQERYEQRGTIIKIKEAMSKLISPIL
ncbi:cardiolipin synthase [Staphylococcus massiliensis]|uniref:cardiolipin synthase n=1 Tax=Staphylococcus massiliensis TaxID=555791 RepID=UPI001EDCE990|nr:cardiolipin synthase [Staphylococcus massiliensis]MCG3402717.1 cardiolipin synthase [Staphylococcus massiliensis]